MDRVQAKAVLALAVALEECERLGVTLSPPADAMESTVIEGEDWSWFLSELSSKELLEAMEAYGRSAKQET